MPAIPLHHTETSDAPFDNAENEANLNLDMSESYYKKAFAWQDPDKDPKTKAGFRFIHHLVSSDGTVGAAALRACSSGIGVLNGARMGTTIPDADRKGVHAHLAAHMMDADMEPPTLKGERAMREHKDFKVTIKAVDDEGTFTGVLSVYDVVDLGGDSVQKGAFTKTLQESGGEIPCFWEHRAPIGSLKVFDGADGLEVQGKLVLEVQQAREALALMKARVVKGLSIGYRTIKSKVENGVRRLTEIALLEGSIVPFPMLPQAQVTGVKSAEEKGNFLTELDRAQVLAMRYMMIEALCRSLDFVIWEGDASPAERITASDESIEQFHQAYISFLPKYFALWDEKSHPTDEQKAGRRISAASAAQLRAAIKVLTALLEPEAAGTELPDEGKAAGAQPAEAAQQDGTQPEPHDAEIHSTLKSFIKQRSVLWTPKS